MPVRLMPGATAAAVMALAGCLERVETVTVEGDGTVTIELIFKTDDPHELHEGDAVPTLAGAWLVEENVEPDEQGRDRFLLRAESVFPPDLDLPGNFAEPGDPDTGLYLQFPTTVLIEDRSDGIYYHFHRVYPAREWARIEALRELLLNERIKKFDRKPPIELSDEELRIMVAAYADYEAAKMLSFARTIYLQITPDMPQDAWLEVDAAVQRLKTAIDDDALLEIMRIEDEDERDQALADELQRWEERSFEGLQNAMREHCGYAGRQMSRFVHGYEAQRKAFKITEDLGDEVFQVTVVMPGGIVGSNADVTGTDRVTWKFSGRRFRDRNVELMVSSKLDR